MSDPKWVVEARKYLGMTEVKGPRHAPFILDLWQRIGLAIREDETPWCAGFVGGVLESVGIRSSKSAAARSYLKFGVPLNKPAYGCIVVFWRGSPSGWSGHVGFLVGKDKHDNLMILGGNQSDAVTIAPFSQSRVLGYVWPGVMPYPERYNLPVLHSDGRVSTNEA